ncbi:MAG: HAD-IB family phosphatase [Halobacteriovoraceae bacterium]|jgi:HAD superfamily hydrolase (TIGR01490 family)|nr:HAD-IB family phosphatase [Halobacteriovoraceae bacterium]MBT5095187.1 HAD-IB family phosphatase [Halobacteriovoraceae bacterium]
MLSLLKRDSSALPGFVENLPIEGQDRLALFDADGTLYTDDVADDFAVYALQQKIISSEEIWQEYLELYPRDPVAGCALALKLYRGLASAELSQLVEKWWQTHAKRNWVTPVMEALFHLKSRGYTIWVVTGTATEFLEPLRTVLPIDKILGMDFEYDQQGLITGEVAGIACAGEGKAIKVRSLWSGGSIDFACGNSMMDIPMLELSQKLCWSVYPDQDFHNEALKRQWQITPRPVDFTEENKFS